MKKLIFMVVVAVALMACNENGAVPAKDKKAVNIVTVEAVNLIGADIATMDKKLTAAGYVKAREAVRAPKQLNARFNEPAVNAEENNVYYVYNIPANHGDLAEAEGKNLLNSILKEGKIIVFATVSYADDKVKTIGSYFYVSNSANANLLYTDISDKLYAKLPSKETATNVYWQGNTHIEEGYKEYKNHPEFTKAILAASQGLLAHESGHAILFGETTGFWYENRFSTPSPYGIKEMENAGYVPYAYAYFFISEY